MTEVIAEKSYDTIIPEHIICAGVYINYFYILFNDINDDESPIKKICDALKEAGVEDVFRHAVLFSPELCDDCGAPLFPDRHGEVVHAEMPEDTPTQQPLFH
jgi:hypothetical protein